jgi:hypothetical protein
MVFHYIGTHIPNTKISFEQNAIVQLGIHTHDYEKKAPPFLIDSP